MNIDNIKELLLKRDGLSNTLGMEFISTPDPDTCQARMKVDERNRQIFGFLSGGASLALAENLAGVGSLDGDTVTATAHILHQGKTLHQWHVDIRNEAGDLISSVEVTNFVMNKPK